MKESFDNIEMIIPSDKILNQDKTTTQLYRNELGLFPMYIYSKGLDCT